MTGNLSLNLPPRWLGTLVGVLALGTLSAQQLTAAEVFVLKTGGRVEGQWLNRNESPREKFLIRTTSGGELAFRPEQVQQVILLSENELLYEKLRPTTADTVAGHEKLAAWCQERGLIDQRHTHLERILQLDSNHEAARAALGYIKSHGEWVTRQELMTTRGLIMYHGRYRTPQEIQLTEEDRKADLAVREWQGKVKRWRSWLLTDKAPDAMAEFRKINDPLAVPALAGYLPQDETRAMKLLLIETLGRIESSAALRALAQSSLQDGDQEVRLSCLDAILKRKDSGNAVNFYIGSLQSKDNGEVNRAAQALRVLADPAAIEALFDALITEHRFKVITKPAGQTSASFPTGGGGGGGGMSFGGDGPRIIVQEFKNPDVLLALVKLTGQNHGYDKADWKQWYASRQRAAGFNARRD